MIPGIPLKGWSNPLQALIGVLTNLNENTTTGMISVSREAWALYIWPLVQTVKDNMPPETGEAASDQEIFGVLHQPAMNIQATIDRLHEKFEIFRKRKKEG